LWVPSYVVMRMLRSSAHRCTCWSKRINHHVHG
jgi:hypothetical protein